MNATQAAIRAGYSAKTAYAIAEKLLRKADVQEFLQQRMKARERRTEITQDRVLQEYARIAFLDPRKLLDGSGRPLPLQDLDDDTAAAIAGLKVVDKYEPARDGAEGNVSTVVEYKLADKKGALDSVARHLGMFNDKLDLNLGGPLAERLARARKRDA